MCLFTNQYLHYLQYWILTCGLLLVDWCEFSFQLYPSTAQCTHTSGSPELDSMFFQHHLQFFFFRLSYLQPSARHLWSTFHILQDLCSERRWALSHYVLRITYIRKRRLLTANIFAQNIYLYIVRFSITLSRKIFFHPNANQSTLHERFFLLV